LVTCYPFVSADDRAEFQTLAATGGIAHAGYPAYVMALELIGKIPIGTFAYRANLLSCLAGALAVGLAAFLGAYLARRSWAGILSGLALACSLTMWSESSQAEVYAFSLAIAASAFLVMWHFGRHPAPGSAFLLGLLGGLGLASHLLILALFPPLVAAIVSAVRTGNLRPAHIRVGVVGLLLGLSTYGYLILKDRPDQPMNYLEDKIAVGSGEFFVADEEPLTRVERIVWMLSARQYLTHGDYRPFAGSGYRLKVLGMDIVVNEFPVWGAALALIGSWVLYRRRSFTGLLLSLWLAGVVFLLLYGTVIPLMAIIFFMPGLWMMSVLMAVGLGRIWDRWPVVAVLLGLLLIGAPFARLSLEKIPFGITRPHTLEFVWRMWPEDWSPLREDLSWDEYGKGVLASLPADAVVLSRWKEGMTLRYFRYADIRRDDVHTRLAENPLRTRFEVRRAEAGGHPVYLTFEPDEFALQGSRIEPAGAWDRGSLWKLSQK
jgi:hypothetical protein